MIVRNVMIEDVTTVSPEDTLQRAYDLIQTKHYDCLPVMEHGRLTGVIQLTDIYEACMKQGREALSRPVGEVMVADPITVQPGELIEAAAKILLQRDIPFLPVTEHGKLVGVVTESDIFKAFSEMLGVDSNTTRLTLLVPDRRGQLARIAEIIRDAGIPIRYLATFRSSIRDQYQIVVRVETNSTRPLTELLEQHGFKVIHVEVD